MIADYYFDGLIQCNNLPLVISSYYYECPSAEDINKIAFGVYDADAYVDNIHISCEGCDYPGEIITDEDDDDEDDGEGCCGC